MCVSTRLCMCVTVSVCYGKSEEVEDCWKVLVQFCNYIGTLEAIILGNFIHSKNVKKKSCCANVKFDQTEMLS